MAFGSWRPLSFRPGWNCRIALVVGVMAVVGALASPAVAVLDEAPPTISDTTVSTHVIDVSTSPQSITVTAHIVDAGSGVSEAGVGSQRTTQFASGGALVRTSGTAADGIYTATLTYATNSNPGAWSLYMYA